MSLPAQPESLPEWRAFRTELREAVGESQYEIWLSGLQVRSWENQTLVLSVPKATQSWVCGRFRGVIERCARRVLGPQARVVLDHVDHGDSRASPAVESRASLPREALNPRYTFEQFIIGEGNRLAHAAALSVAEQPGGAFNPLFLYAPPGLGKTHLLHAIGHYVRSFGAGATVRYTTAESFTNHFLTALSAKTLEPFKRAYRDADVLLIDDVQFLASKVRTGEEFFHTFDALYETGRQLVFTCDRLPRALLDIEARLRERFGAGLVADMVAPDHATRVAILRKRAALDGIRVTEPAVLDLIAARVTHNIRALEGALIRVVAYHSLTQQPLDLALATKAMDTMYPIRGTRQPTITEVQQTVAARYAVSTTELVSAVRTARVAWPRQLAIHLARELTGASLQGIGEAFGGRNHATVLHACKRVAERLSSDESVSGELTALHQQLGQRQADRDY